MKRWYVVHSHPREEARAFGHLTRQGFDAWLPYRRTIRRHARRTEAVLRPLFPRYLFVRVDLAAERWRPILSTSGVQALVSGGDAPLAVADETIEGLQARAGADGIFEIKPRALKPGERVRILRGPMAELEGIFQAESDAERITLLLSLMGRSVRVTVADTDIERP